MRRQWTSRLLLEASLHAASWFVTLTYSEEHLPKDGCVWPRVLQLFMKRLRERVREPLRFYGCGEYGGFLGRPHYHLALFGLVDRGHVEPGDVRFYGECSCSLCKAWGMGGVSRRPLEPETAAYVAGYTVDKCTDDMRVVRGERAPEFARMSLRPGIGRGAVSAIAEGVRSPGGQAFLQSEGDVPGQIRQRGKLWPLGRYLRGKVRQEMGMDPRVPFDTFERVQREAVAELSAPGARARRDSERVQVERNVTARQKIQSSKKGVGL